MVIYINWFQFNSIQSQVCYQLIVFIIHSIFITSNNSSHCVASWLCVTPSRSTSHLALPFLHWMRSQLHINAVRFHTWDVISVAVKTSHLKCITSLCSTLQSLSAPRFASIIFVQCHICEHSQCRHSFSLRYYSKSYQMYIISLFT